MKTFAFTQACEGRSGAARMVSVRAAIPFIGIPLTDLSTVVGIIIIVFFIFTLVHAQLKKSRRNTLVTGQTAEKERDDLERRIATRTQELITAETERLNELNRTVQFGELSKGLFHDLMNPLASISLYLEKLEANPTEPGETREVVRKMIDVSRRMNSYMESVRHCIGNAPEISALVSADVSEELRVIRDILGYKARTAGVNFAVMPSQPYSLSIHPVRLHQLLLNLTSNAIEACAESLKTDPEGNYAVTVTAAHSGNTLSIIVADNGCGMSEQHVNALFKQQFSTKDHGLGIGLKTVKTIVEEELKGSIEVMSEKSRGTSFIVKIPI
jgi:two-component system, sporulation sensor kinase E